MDLSTPTAAKQRRINATVAQLASLLPSGWGVEPVKQAGDVTILEVSSTDGSSGSLALLTAERLEPSEVHSLWLPDDAHVVLSADWLSQRSRDLLRERGVSYVDRSGNVEIRLTRPALYVRTDGSARDPDPKPAAAPRVRGPRAWALMRTLAEVRPPYTAGELAEALDMDDGYVSRILQALVDDRLIERSPRGPVTAAAWEQLLRKVSSTYSLLAGNITSTWIAAAGAERLLGDLSGLTVGRWAVTGSFVASGIAPVAAPEMAVVYSEDPEGLAMSARLLRAKTGANVVLAQPYDPIVFERVRNSDGARSVSIAQAAIDCLTGPGRMPAEGEALLAWMSQNESIWRATSLTGAP